MSRTTKKHIFKSLSDGLQIATFEPMATDSFRYSSFLKKKRRIKFQEEKTRATYAERQNYRRFANAIRCNSGNLWEQDHKLWEEITCNPIDMSMVGKHTTLIECLTFH